MIKAYEGQTVHNAMIDAIVRQEMERQNNARVAELEAENARLRDELALRRQKDAAVYTRFIRDAARDYPEPRRGTRLGDVLWALVGYVVLGFGALFERLGV